MRDRLHNAAILTAATLLAIAFAWFGWRYAHTIPGG